MGCLYCLTFPSGKKYIGITSKTADVRFHRHVEHATICKRTNAVHRAIIKYGAENVKVDTLVIADDFKYLRFIEKRAIQSYGTLSPNGYNLTGGGEDSGFWAQESVEKSRNTRIATWAAIEKSQRVELTKKAIDAMRKALSDPACNEARSKKISETMLSSKSKIAHGADRPNAKLNTEKVARIRQLIDEKQSDQTIALIFGVSRELIRDIRTGKRWKQ